MSKRKGELSRTAIDRGWPHQVALPSEDCIGDRYATTHYFCKDLSLCLRTGYFYRGNRGYVVFCFAELGHAEMFRERFGGEIVDPKMWRRCWRRREWPDR